jgi:hypothetical protein
MSNKWALKKMTQQFNNFKNTLYRNYVKDKKPPEWTGVLENQEKHWPAFLAYKESEEAKARCEKNKINADKKKYYHKLGPGGYKTAEPKWDKDEAEMRSKGIIPVTDDWDKDEAEMRTKILHLKV